MMDHESLAGWPELIHMMVDSEISGPAREDKPHFASTFKSLLMLHLLLSHWPKQVIWSSPESL